MVLGLLLLATLVIYCLFAIVTNVIASGSYQTAANMDPTLVSNYGILALSLGSKQLNATK